MIQKPCITWARINWKGKFEYPQVVLIVHRISFPIIKSIMSKQKGKEIIEVTMKLQFLILFIFVN